MATGPPGAQNAGTDAGRLWNATQYDPNYMAMYNQENLTNPYTGYASQLGGWTGQLANNMFGGGATSGALGMFAGVPLSAMDMRNPAAQQYTNLVQQQNMAPTYQALRQLTGQMGTAAINRGGQGAQGYTGGNDASQGWQGAINQMAGAAGANRTQALNQGNQLASAQNQAYGQGMGNLQSMAGMWGSALGQQGGWNQYANQQLQNAYGQEANWQSGANQRYQDWNNYNQQQINASLARTQTGAQQQQQANTASNYWTGLQQADSQNPFTGGAQSGVQRAQQQYLPTQLGWQSPLSQSSQTQSKTWGGV